MATNIMLIVAVTSVIQSMFGAGVLLFGTPLLLLFGYEFVDILIVLLPISLASTCCKSSSTTPISILPFTGKYCY